jgi:CubicO group peptidase (beta-lactamase class C family)
MNLGRQADVGAQRMSGDKLQFGRFPVNVSMRRKLVFLLALVTMALGARPQAQNLVFDLFSGYVESLRVQAGIPALATAIVGTDAILWERAYGRQDLTRAIAARTDTLFHADGLTEMFTATMVLRCAEERRLSLDEPVGQFGTSAEPSATIRQVLTHTSGPPGSLLFTYRPERLAPLWPAIRSCTDNSFRETLANLLHRLAMMNSVPGADVADLQPPAEGVPDPPDLDRYKDALTRLATPYAVDSRGRASASQYQTATLTPSAGLITTVRDLANFQLALQHGLLVQREALDTAWRATPGANGELLPHGMGWFVQSFNGEKVVWQFGEQDNASSALVVTLPARGLTLIMMANSDRLAKPLPLVAGDVSVSPFARVFLSLFAK